ncbi:MAG TPA: peptide ABC transporter substrate-binding protein [Candidatus Limnocylindria bacterium]|nr:peptide ABC transporter substrate-binding protein [Candidatus Limnocylindria bacterium]
MRAHRAGLAAFLACILVLAGCTRETPQSAGGRHAWTQPNVLRLADIADPDSLDPLLSTMDLSYDLSSLIFSYLVVSDAHGKLIGDLATKVPTLANGGISTDGKTYTYHLRSGVVWHDGAPFTARDVAFSWRAIMSPRNNVLHREGYEEVASVATPDDHTVVVHLRRRYPPFVTQFFTTLQEGAKPVVPAHLLAAAPEINDVPFNAHPVGTGPFRFVRWDRGHQIVLEANPRYFRGRPKLDRIVLEIVPDMNTVATLLRTHEVDLAVTATPLVYSELRGADGLRETLTDWNAARLLMLDDVRPALRHPEVRQAIARAIDFPALIRDLTYGTGAPAHDILPPTSLGYVANPPYPYDPAAASALLEHNGWKLGRDGVRVKDGVRLELVMVIASAGDDQAFGVQLQQMLRTIGIRVVLKPYPYKGIYAYDGPIVKGTFDLALFRNTLEYDPDSTSTLSCAAFAPQGENEARFCDPHVDALERDGLATDDPHARAAIYREIGRLVHDEVAYIPLYRAQRPSVFNEDLRGYDPAPVAASWWDAYRWSI